MSTRKGLGKGLEALMGEAESINYTESASEIPITDIHRDPKQPRQQFDPEALEELTNSVREHGVITPILVRPVADNHYKLVAGERRFRAAMSAGLQTIPAVVKNISEREAMEIALIENLQRENLNPVEEAMGYRRLMDEFNISQEEVAKRVGKSRPAIANSMRILNLPEDALELLKTGQLTAGHAKAILAFGNDFEKMSLAAKHIAANEMSVREAEKYCRPVDKAKKKSKSKHSGSLQPSLPREVEISLKDALGVNVVVKSTTNTKGEIKGTLSIDFVSAEQLKEFANKLGKK